MNILAKPSSVVLLAFFALLCGPMPCAQAQTPPALKTESFDRDPGWEAHNNHIVPKKIPTVVQDFGYAQTNFAGKAPGELGGRITRANQPAYYGARIEKKTLDDKLSASGSFALTATGAGGGVFFGWFGAAQPGGGGRPVNSLGLEFAGEKIGARLAVTFIAHTNKVGRRFITPFVPGGPARQRPSPLKNDGTRYHWTLTYDPQGTGGAGRVEFMIRSDSAQPDEFEGKVVAIDVPDYVRKDGAVFDHFGLMNLMKAGGTMDIHFDDVRFDDKAADFTADPQWEGAGNRATYADADQAGAHDFGWSAKTNRVGGAPGEIGGKLWRAPEAYGYYADRLGRLTLEDRLEARGGVVLDVGAPDSGMYLGWFNSADKERAPAGAGNFLAVHIGGPTRIGHYFQPAYATAGGKQIERGIGPVLTPQKVFPWKLLYDPTADGGEGAIEVTLGTESIRVSLKPGDKAKGAVFDRFGLFTSTDGGALVRIYLDDLEYTAGAPK